jgi:hypothetical protein
MLSLEADMTSFDAHQYAKRLIAAGASPAEADVHAEALTQVTDEVATLERRVDAQQCKAESAGFCLAAQLEKSHFELGGEMSQRFEQFGERINGRFTDQNTMISDRFTDQNTMISDRFAEQDRMISGRFAEQDKLIIGHFAEQDREINIRFSEQDKKLAELSEKIVQAKLENMRWTLGIVLSVASLQTGVIAAMLHWMR